MKKLILGIFIILLYSLPSFSLTNSIVTQSDIYNDYILFLNGRDPLTIEYFGGKHSRRDVVEMIMILQALKYGGYNKPVEFMLSPTDKRDISLLISGVAVARATSIWSNDVDQHKLYMYKSIPVIDLGEFVAGFYTTTNNKDALAARDLSDIQNLKIISSKFWTVDWITLKQLKIKNLYHTARWENMVSTVKDKNADILLAPFQPTNDLSFTIDGTKFVPIPNLKIGLMATRHFVVSKKHPDGEKLFKALNIGLKVMKEKGLIKKIYIESGFINPNVKNWKSVN